MPTEDELREALRLDYKRLERWQKVGDKWGISRSMAWQIANTDYMPQDRAIRRRLNVRKEERKRVLIDLPPDVDDDELERIRSMSKQERLRRLKDEV